MADNPPVTPPPDLLKVPSYLDWFKSNGTFGRIVACYPGDTPEKEQARVALEFAEAQYHAGGLSPKESVELRAEIDRLSQIVNPGVSNAWPPYNADELAYFAQQRAELEDALMGPVLNKPGQLTRALGAPPQVVSAVHEGVFNAAAAKAFEGEPSAAERALIARPAAAEPPPLRGKLPPPEAPPAKPSTTIFPRQYLPLDWKGVARTRGRYRGQASEDHVRLHNVDDPGKPDHGVFYGDGVDVTDEAWKRAQDLGIAPDANGELVVPMDRIVGRAGGAAADTGALFDSVFIKVIQGTNKIVTAYPVSGGP